LGERGEEKLKRESDGEYGFLNQSVKFPPCFSE
jgi:hypothetical protein